MEEVGGGWSQCKLEWVQGEEQGRKQEQEGAPGEASEECLCMHWENPAAPGPQLADGGG